MIDKELLKPQLQKAIEAKFAEKFGKGEVAAIEIVNGIIPEWLRQIRTGQFSKNPEHQTWGNTYEGFCIREENRDKATEQLRGFLYGIEAAGLLNEEEAEELRTLLNDMRADETRDPYLSAMKNTASKASIGIEED